MSELDERPVVFAGPSARGLAPEVRSKIDLRPPARRGEIEALASRPRPGTAVLVDGLVGSSMAVTPTECRRVLEAGWRLCGAASMGALRASELWSVGMVGVGDVFLLLRLGVLDSDADVAVAYDPDTFAEVSAALVHVRAVLAVLGRRGWERERCRELLDAARSIHWCERSWQHVWAAWRAAGASPAELDAARALSVDAACHPKIADARAAVRAVLAQDWMPHLTDERTGVL